MISAQNAHKTLKSYISRGVDYHLVGKGLRFLNQKEKLARTNAQIEFLIACRHEKVIPKTVKLSLKIPNVVRNNNKVNYNLSILEKSILNGMISGLFSKRKGHEEEIENISFDIFHTCDVFRNDLWQLSENIYYSTFKRFSYSHQKKLQYLRKFKRDFTFENRKQTNNKTNLSVASTRNGNKPTDPKSNSKEFSKHSDAKESDKVVVATTEDIPKQTVDLLSRGPKFALTPPSKIDVLNETEVGLNRLLYQYRWSLRESNKRVDVPSDKPNKIASLNSLLSNAPFEKWTSAPPIAPVEQEFKINNLSQNIFCSTEKHLNSLRPNCTKEELSSIKNLQRNDKIIIKKTDKSKAFSIQDSKDYVNKNSEEHLSDTTTYEKLDKTKDHLSKIENKIKRFWNPIAKRNSLPFNLKNIMNPSDRS